MIYFSSDWHLGHKNILIYDDRPFKNIDHHDDVILTNYASIVNDDDTFYYLGDFSLCNIKRAEAYMQRLPGHKYFIKGNHDKREHIRLYEKYGTFLGQQTRIDLEGENITLNHFAMRVWDKSHRGAWCLYGHSHGNMDKHTTWGKSMDVGVNIWDYKPLSFEQIKKIMDKREVFYAGDHHREDVDR